MEALNDFVVLGLGETELKTDTGIYLPKGAREENDRHTVLAVGPEVGDLVRVGDVVQKPDVTAFKHARGGQGYDFKLPDDTMCITVKAEEIAVVWSRVEQV